MIGAGSGLRTTIRVASPGRVATGRRHRGPGSGATLDAPPPGQVAAGEVRARRALAPEVVVVRREAARTVDAHRRPPHDLGAAVVAHEAGRLRVASHLHP